jgi:hypothetical protein
MEQEQERQREWIRSYIRSVRTSVEAEGVEAMKNHLAMEDACSHFMRLLTLLDIKSVAVNYVYNTSWYRMLLNRLYVLYAEKHHD